MEDLQEFEYDGNTELDNLPDAPTHMPHWSVPGSACLTFSPLGYACSLATGHESPKHVAFTTEFEGTPAKIVAVWTATS